MKSISYSARTDFATVPISKVPTIPPAGAIATDPDFNTPILRVTGPGFNPLHPDFAYFAGIGGSADVNVWNRQSTKFVFEDQGNRVFAMQFAPDKMKVAPLYPTFYKQGTFCIEGGGRAEFSHFGDVLFQYNGLKILEHDFGQSPSAPPTPKLVYDFTAALPGFNVTWQSIGGASADGKTFAIALSNSGNQGTGTTIMIYRTGKGWRKFDTFTGLVTGQWGQVGTIQSSDRFTVHNIKLSPGGKFLIIATAAVEGNSIKNKHFWNLETLEMSVISTFTGGHFTEGYAHFINNGGIPFGQYQARAFSAPGIPEPLIVSMPSPPLVPILDSHLSWNNCDPADTAPFFATTTSPRDTWQPWQNEILGIQGGKVYRFCHTMNTGKSPLFSTANAIGSVSQDARFMLICSDWMGQTKGDVFIVPLR